MKTEGFQPKISVELTVPGGSEESGSVVENIEELNEMREKSAPIADFIGKLIRTIEAQHERIQRLEEETYA